MIRLACAWYCAVVLWISGAQHLANKYYFFGTILDYQLVTPTFAALTASVLPLLHLMLAALLIAPGVRSKTPFLSVALLALVFIAVQATVLVRGISVDCGCFGAMSNRPVGGASLATAASLALAGLAGAGLTAPGSQRRDEAFQRNHGQSNHGVLDAIDSSEQVAASISIIIPVFNEGATIGQVVKHVERVASKRRWDWQLLIVDDGSTDETPARLAEYAQHERIRLYRHDANRGKGSAIRTALAEVGRELTVIQDADLEYDPEQISALIQARAQTGAAVVYGSRVLGAASGITNPRWNVYAAGVLMVNIAVWLIYGRRITDEATCYKLFRTADLRRMELSCVGFEFCPEVTAKSARLGLSILEIPIRYRPRSVRDGKKVRFRDAVVALKTLWRFRQWTPQNG
jgi:dolichol-phosphate mannosyltransferase